MADIVFGFATSHSPQLALKPDEWEIRAKADRENPAHPFRDGVYNYDELVALRRDENFAAEIVPDRSEDRYRRCQTAMDDLGERIRAANPDIMVIIGDDQRDWFFEEIQPAFTIFHGEKILHDAPEPEKMAGVPQGMVNIQLLYHPEADRTYEVPSDLARHIIDAVMEDGFDIATSDTEPTGAHGPIGMGHAFGFVYRRLLNDAPIPLVPVFLNTYYPPNQPKARRCFDFGRAIGRAIASWPGNARVALGASGGLSHFAIDETLDRRLLDAMLRNDAAAMTGDPNSVFQSGTSEIKNWIATAGALSDTGLKMELIDYVPCYRSEAGTGTAMGFAAWR